MGKRIVAIDVLRGMTIFFMIIVNSPGSWEYVYSPLRHSNWSGCTPTDLVFPFFLYVVGLAMAFSFRKYQHSERSQWIKKVLKRTALIFIIGLLLNWYPFHLTPISDLRILGVLQRIALAYCFASLLVIYFGRKWIVNKILLILLGYWAMMYWLGTNGDPYSLEDNFARGVDISIFGESHVYHGYGIPFDPEGLFSTIPAVATVLIGYWIGILIQSRRNVIEKLKVIAPYAVGGIVFGLIWALFFPINKPIWSSSYVLYSAGWATLILMGLIWLIDNKGIEKWGYPFKVFGLNPLFSYVLSIVLVDTLISIVKVGDQSFYGFLFRNIYQPIFGSHFGSLMVALSVALLVWLFAWWLYRKGKVIKI